MPLIEWSSRFELGVMEFDEHHKHFVSLLNKIHDYVTTGASYDSLEAVLEELADYATYHFAAEVYWMRVYKYPDLKQHQKEHERFSTRVAEIQKEFYGGKTELSHDVLAFLKNWLSYHILNTDAEYGRFAMGLPHNKR